MNFIETKIAALLVTAGLVFSVSGQNLIENADFGNGVSEWAPPSWELKNGREWLYPAVDKKACPPGADGSASIRLDWTKKHLCAIRYQKEIELPKTAELELSFWAKSEGYSDTNQVGLCVDFPEVQDNTKKMVMLYNPWNRSPKEWTYYEKRIKVPENATKAKLAIKIHGYKSEKGTSWLNSLYFGPVREKSKKAEQK